MKKLFSQITQSAAKYLSYIKAKPIIICLLICIVFVITPRVSDAKLNSGLYILSDPSYCGPCVQAASVIKNSEATVVKPTDPVGVELMKQLPADTKIPNAVTVDSDGKVVENSTINNKSAKQIEDMKKRLADKEYSLQTKFEKDRCWLIPPGMSLVNGNIYGESGVKAFLDKYGFLEDGPAKLGCGMFEVPRPEPKGPDPRFKYDTKVGKGPEPCVYATDYQEKPATRSAGSGKVNSGGGIESKENNDIRDKQIDKSGQGFDMFSMTMEDDVNYLTTEAIQNLHMKAGSECPRISNEECQRTLAEKEAKAAGGGQAIPALGKNKAPTMQQHLDYWLKNNATFIKLAPPETTGINIRPGICPVSLKDHPTCQTNEAASVVSKLVPDKPAADNNQNSDLIIKSTGSSCTYEKSTAQPQDPNKNPFDWKDPNGTGSPGGNGPGGDGPGGQGGALQKLLPALMQALQGLGQGGGQQQGQQSPSLSPSPTPYVCPNSSTDEKVCGTDGITYISQCVAEYENQVSVKHTGICTSSDSTNASTSDSISTISSLLNQLTSSGIPDSLISNVTQAIINLLTGALAGGNTASQTTVQ